MILLDKFSDVFITSDIHASHRNICRGVSTWDLSKYMTRNFSDIEEMNDKIIENINKTVPSDALLIQMGDLSFNGFDNIEKIVKRINCKNIISFIGNHDHHIQRNKNNICRLFLNVFYMDCMMYAGKCITLCHFPIDEWYESPKGGIMLHGHLHSSPENRITLKNRIDVGIDGHPEFRPYHMSEIMGLLK